MSPNLHNPISDENDRRHERFLQIQQQQQQQQQQNIVNETTFLMTAAESSVSSSSSLVGAAAAAAPRGPCDFPVKYHHETPRRDHSFAYSSFDRNSDQGSPAGPRHVFASCTRRQSSSTCFERNRRMNKTNESSDTATVAASASISKKATICSPTMKPPFTNLPWNRDAVHFGIRMAVCITISSLFSLWPQDTTERYPQSMWILITVLFVCWFPSLDAASVVEKSLQRLYGTFIGASVGLLCGFISLAILGWRGETETNTNVVYHPGRQALFVGVCICLYTFIICWAAVQYQVRGKRIIASYNYACILCLLTFYICIMPFYVDDDDIHASHQGNNEGSSNPNHQPHARWHKAIYRVINVIVGCVLGAVLSITILPRSTVQNLQSKMERQIQLAGQASRAVLWSAADVFSDNLLLLDADGDDWDDLERGAIWPPRPELRVSLEASQRTWRHSSRLDNNLAVDDGDGEEALRKHEAAIQESRLIQSQLGILKYDPFHLTTPDQVIQAFAKEVRHTLARALRIQHTVVLLDGIVRNDPKHDFSQWHIQLFADVGSLIHDMLAVPDSGNQEKESGRHKEEAYKELKLKLAQVRGSIIELSAVVAQTSQQVPARQMGKIGVGILGSRYDLTSILDSSTDEQVSDEVEDNVDPDEDEHPVEMEEDDQGRGAPKFVHGSRVCALLFLQLVEHLALRSVRLYQSWKYCELLCHAAEQREMHSSLTGQMKARYRAYHKGRL